MSKIRDKIKEEASKSLFNNKMVDNIKSEAKKLTTYINVLGQLKIIGVDFGGIEENMKIIQEQTMQMLEKLQKIQDESKKDNKKIEDKSGE